MALYSAVLLFFFVYQIFAAPKQRVDSEIDLETWCEGKPADIFFLLDTSTSITHSDFRKQKEFVQDLISVFDISEYNTRVAVSTFSTYYYPMIRFGQHNDKTNLINAVGRIRHRGGNTNTGGAIKRMVEGGFSSARRGVAHIAFVLTDGQSQLGHVTIKEAAKAKKAGIYMYAIGIGRGVDEEELRAIGSEPEEDFVYHVPSFSVLFQLKEDLAATACIIEAQKDQPACGHNMITDMMFTFDSSAMGAAKSRKIYSFISNVSDHFSKSEGNIRTGVLSRHCPENDITLNMYDNKYQLINGLHKPRLHGLDHLVEKLYLESFLAENGGRDEATHAAVLFIDNDTDKLHKIKKQAIDAKLQGIKLFIVNIGTDNKKLEDIASEHIWNIDSCDDLDTIKMNLIDTFC